LKRLPERKPSIYVWLGLSLSLLALLPISSTVPVALLIGSHYAISVTAVLSIFLGLILIGAFLRLLVTEPLTRTAMGAGQLAKGDLGVMLPPSHVGEIDDVHAALNFLSAELQNSREAREALEMERRLLIGGVAHDLRTPLFALMGYLEGLEAGIAESPERKARYIEGAKERAQRLERLISQLFDFARLEFPESSLELKPFDLTESLVTLLDGFQSLADSSGIKLVMLRPDAQCLIYGDEDLLTRAVGNLLDNALRYTPSSGSITVAWGPDGKDACISVADTGPGISVADLPHIFKPAYRGKASNHQSQVGAGLGLTIASQIIESHGGRLSAENNPAGGAMFRARIPATRQN
jgi:signal transduction histidine kinase